MDAEKQTIINTDSLIFDAEDTYWIDWKKDGNLLASCGDDEDVKLYDVREGRKIKYYPNIHTSKLRDESFSLKILYRRYSRSQMEW